MDGVTDTLAKEFGVTPPEDALRAPALTPEPIRPQRSVTEQLAKEFSVDQDEKLKQSVSLGSERNPETTARVLKIVEKTNLPAQYVEENLDEMERAVSIKSFDPANFRQKSPKFAEWLAKDPRNVALAKNDLSVWQSLEQTWSAYGVGSAEAQLQWEQGVIARKILGGGKLSAHEQAQWNVIAKDFEELERRKKRFGFAEDWAGKAGYILTQIAAQVTDPNVVKRAVEGATIGTGVGAAAGGLIGTAGAPVTGGLSVPALAAAGAVTGAARGAFVGLATGGGERAATIEAGATLREFYGIKDLSGKKLDPKIAETAAAAVGVINGVIEVGSELVLGKIWGALPSTVTNPLKLQAKSAIMQGLKNPTMRAGLVKVLAKLVASGGSEGFEEFVQNFVQGRAQDIAEATAGGVFKDRPLGEETVEGGRQALEAFVTVMAGGPVLAALPVARVHHNVQQSKRNVQAFKDFGEHVKALSTHQKSPEVTREGVKAIAPGENVYIKVDRFDALFQEDAPSVAQEVLGDTKQYNEAKALGADLVIPVEVYAEKLAGTEFHEQLIPDLRWKIGDLSANEVSEIANNAPAIEEEQAEAAELRQAEEAKSAEIHKEVYGSIKPFMGDLEAQRNATIAATRATARAKVLGVDPLELWKQEGPIITRDILAKPTVQANQQAVVEAFAGYTPERVDSLISTYTAPGRSGYVVQASPAQFLGLTATPFDQAILERSTRPLDEQDLRDTKQPIYLKAQVTDEGLQVIDHEGRHRMLALQRAGIESVPIVLDLGGQQADIAGLTLQPQKGAKVPTQFTEAVSLRPENRDQLVRMGEGAEVLYQATEPQYKQFAALAKVEAFLKPEERKKLRTDTAARLADLLTKLPSAQEMASVALAGKAKRGWYQHSAEALVNVFGADAPRFAALLAAMSPQTSVENNLLNALHTWKNWIAGGRPTTRADILKVMGESVQGEKGVDSVLDAWRNNSVRALTSTDPAALVLSGPKVNSFYRNLIGVTDEVTNDAWMANYAAVDQAIFSGSLNVAGTDPGKGPGYLAMSVQVRRAAQQLTKMTGEKWTPAEVQETVWSWAKATYELAASAEETRPAVELVKAGELTDNLINATPDFRSLFHDPTYQKIIEDAGYAQQLAALEAPAWRHGGAGDQVVKAEGQAATVAPNARHLVAAARRLDALRAARKADEPLYQTDPWYYSPLKRAVEQSKTASASAGQWLATLRNVPGVKPGEIVATGLEEFLSLQTGKVTREQVRAYLESRGFELEETLLRTPVDELTKQNVEEEISAEVYAMSDAQVRIEFESIFGEEANMRASIFRMRSRLIEERIEQAEREHLPSVLEPRFSDLQIPGEKSDYREVAITLPGPEFYRVPPAHSMGEAADVNRIVHVRFNTRMVDGKKVLFLEEVQSDWAQKGRREGFADTHLVVVETSDGQFGLRHPSGRGPSPGLRFDTRAEAERAARSGEYGIPSAPFVTKTEQWVGLALKRMIRYAVENGFDRVAWTTGEQQADRYDLSKQAKEVIVKSWPDVDSYGVSVVTQDGQQHFVGEMKAEKLPEVVGKELAEKIVADLPKGSDTDKIYSGLDLKVGGEGMRNFYDKIVVNTANKILKPLGGGRVVPLVMKEGTHILPRPMVDVVPISNGRFMPLGADGFQIPENDRDNAAFSTIELARAAAARIAERARKVPYKIEQPSFDITPEMKANVMRGQTLFQGNVIRGQFERAPAGARPLITLFKSANPSTLLHELGHSWLEELRRDAAYAQQQIATGVTTNRKNFEQLIADWAIVKKWGAIPDTLRDDEQIPRESHEMFARAVEAYLREGRAPSVELRNVFARFKDWLTMLYKSAKDLNVEMTDELRGVLDRMLATDEEIAQARQMDGMTRPVVPLEQMTSAEAAVIQRLSEEVQRDAEDSVRAQTMRELVRERQDWWKREKAAVAEEVAGEFNAQLVYRALSWLRTGKLPDGGELEGIEHQRLSRDVLSSAYANIPLRTMPPFTYQRDGGIHPDVAAELFGFETGDEMLRAMIAAKSKAQEIAKEVDRIMMERHGDMLNDGSIAERAAEAVHGDKQADVLLAELRILNRMGAKGKLVPRQFMRAMAERMVEGQKVGELRPKYYEIMARRNAYEAEKAMINDEVDEAFDAKMRQLMNLHLFRVSSEQKQAVDKAIKGWKVLDRSDDRLAKTRNLDLVNAARAVLGDFGLGRGQGTAASHLAKLQEYDPLTYADVSQTIALIAGEEKPYKQLTVAEFSQVRDAVDGLWNTSRTYQQSVIDGRRVDREVVRGALVDRLHTYRTPKAKREYTRALSAKDKAGGTLLGAKAWLRRVESWVDAIDGGDFDGPFRKYIWQPISEAATHYREVRKTTLQKYLAIVKEIEGTFDKKLVRSEDLKHEFGNESGNARQEIIGALLHTGNESNFQKLLLGRKWGELREDGTLDTSRWDAFIRDMEARGIITKSDYDFVQKVWDLLEELKAPAQQAHKEIYGYYFSEITARPLQTPFGQYRGGYFPAIADSDIVDEAAVREDRAALEQQQNSFMFPTTGRGFTKSRVAAYNKALKLDVGLIPQHIDKVLKFTFIEPRMKEVGRLMIDREFRAEMNAVDSRVIGAMVMPWLQRSATQAVDSRPADKTASDFDKLWRGLRSRTGAQIMVGNVVNTLQQYTGFSLAATKVAPGQLNQALWTYLRSPKQVGEEIAAKSEFMRNRVTTAVFEVQQEIDDILLNPTKYEKAKDFAAKHGYFLQTHAQSQVDTVAWLGAYNEAIATGSDELGAVRRADSAVRLTQGTFAAEDISRFETGAPLARVFTMFYSYFNMQANLLTTEFSKIVQTSGFSAPGRLFYMYMMGFMIPAVVAESIAQLMSGEAWEDSDDDDDWLMKKMLEIFFMGQIRTGLAMGSFAGQAVTVGINQYNDKWYDDRISTSPVVGAIEATMRAPRSVYRALTDEGSDRRAVRDTLTAISLITGLPVAFLGRPLGYLADVNEGRAEPANAADFVRGLISGRAPQ